MEGITPLQYVAQCCYVILRISIFKQQTATSLWQYYKSLSKPCSVNVWIDCICSIQFAFCTNLLQFCTCRVLFPMPKKQLGRD